MKAAFAGSMAGESSCCKNQACCTMMRMSCNVGCMQNNTGTKHGAVSVAKHDCCIMHVQHMKDSWKKQEYWEKKKKNMRVYTVKTK